MFLLHHLILVIAHVCAIVLQYIVHLSFATYNHWFLVSGGDLVANAGQLASPRYPRDYQHNLHVTWNIIVDVGKKVRIEFTSLDIEGSSTCQYDYIQVIATYR